MTVSRQSMSTMATRVVTTMIRFAKTELAVSVTTDCTPPTSLERRLWIFARAGLREEPQGHRLQVRVERVAEVLHDVLADAVVDIRLPHADEAADDGDGDHGHDEDVEQQEVLLRDGHVDELLQEVSG